MDIKRAGSKRSIKGPAGVPVADGPTIALGPAIDSAKFQRRSCRRDEA